ncbi:hypothetical protein [Neorhodopirellula pilleata]|uniref:Uncharacterized protein n=1 Tax=Neorhodopirellula pilleata TaxID=2714738 RepID=A0A5C6AIE2_9BACT|nr:hypothetical protein [Neorhodopirellula pilleata]TWT99018.1 hypothetical protein Pla100_21910 [Neorhodopirellula pilleata]
MSFIYESPDGRNGLLNSEQNPQSRAMRLFSMMIAVGFLVSCSGKNGNAPGVPGNVAGSAFPTSELQSVDTRSAQGVLRHYRPDVKSTQAWLGHEFMVGETPILPTKFVPSETLRGMVGRTVIVEGVWNSGKTWSQPTLTDDDDFSQNPIFAEDAMVVRGSGIEVRSVSEVHASDAAISTTNADEK